MRESEMRRRAESLIRRGMQGMISPSFALSLALAGCGGSDYMAQMPRHDGGVRHDGGGAVSDTPIYSAPIPDALGPDQGLDVPAIDVGLGPEVGVEGPALDASTEAAGHDADQGTRG